MNQDIGSSTEENKSRKTFTSKSWWNLPIYRSNHGLLISRKERDLVISKTRNFEIHQPNIRGRHFINLPTPQVTFSGAHLSQILQAFRFHHRLVTEIRQNFDVKKHRS